MYARWLSVGNRAELAIYPGDIHAFNLFPIELARRANARLIEFLSKALKEPNALPCGLEALRAGSGANLEISLWKEG